ncbi:MAG: copper chaperone PCu(A)C [Brevundimonas sp.]|uniref:copper chaperone PCu(A)C n=1 Tax=Brevundimonas sp. TaxID=1871086 RepID=UPI002488414B|nr:copper chaperone PCu(A)C [Brevundimonas sp.]MDI1327173.1 copper chaperone PCu(A)C [Brevundimonas sp.]
MNRALVSAAALLMLAACNSGERAPEPGAPTVMVADALCRPTPKGRKMTGCYMTLTASGADRLVSVESPDANIVQIHESRMESNMMMMRELRDGLPLAAGQATVLAPGGNHLMLLGVKEPLVAGDTVALKLTFETATPVEVTATVGQPATPENNQATAH